MLDVNKVKYWYTNNLWTEVMVRNAVIKGKLTSENYKEITGKEYQ